MPRPPSNWKDNDDTPQPVRDDLPDFPGAGAEALKDASRGERLQKVLAEAGIASRRACETLRRVHPSRARQEASSVLPHSFVALL